MSVLPADSMLNCPPPENNTYLQQWEVIMCENSHNVFVTFHYAR